MNHQTTIGQRHYFVCNHYHETCAETLLATHPFAVPIPSVVWRGNEVLLWDLSPICFVRQRQSTQSEGFGCFFATTTQQRVVFSAREDVV